MLLRPVYYMISSMSKSKLNEYCQRSHISVPSYSTIKEGDLFVSEVTVSGGRYRSVNAYEAKKEAEHDAATVALRALLRLHPAIASVDDLLASLEPGKKKKKGGSTKPISAESVHPVTRVVGSATPVGSPPPVGSVTPVGSPPPLGSTTPVGSPPPVSRATLVGSPQLSASESVADGSYLTPETNGPMFQVPLGQAHMHPISVPLGVVGHPPAPFPQPVFVQGGIGFPYALRGGMIHPSPVPHGIPVPLSAPFQHPAPPAGNFVIRQQSGPMTRSASPSLPGSIPFTKPGSVPSIQRLDKGLKMENGSSVSDFEKELDRYCSVRSLCRPVYSIGEIGGRYSGKVVVNDVEYIGSCNQTSFVLAKTSAALVALASIGLEALKLEEKAARSLPGSVTARGDSKSPSEAQTSGCHRPVSSKSVPVCVSGSPSLSSVESVSTPASKQLQTPTYFSENNSRASSCGGSISSPQSQQTFHNLGSTANRGISVTKMANHKVSLTTYCQKKGLDIPRYECTYPEDAVGYIATVHVNGKTFTSNTEGTKRGAESTAAALALSSFGESVAESVGGATSGTSVKNGNLAEPVSFPAEERNVSYKNILQEYIQQSRLTELPRYSTERTDDGFVSTVVVRMGPDKSLKFKGTPYSNKRASEQASAKVACAELKLVT